MSETKGRCRSEVDSYRKPEFHYAAIADAIDRLAADVASIKATIDAVAPEDVAHLVESEKAWVAMVTAIRERDEARAEVERFKAIVHSDAGHMARILNEIERLKAERAAPQPAAPPWGWLTEEEKRCLPEVLDDLRRWGYAKSADVIEALLSRAGSPPVVEVPLFENYAPEVLHLRYRDAISSAGIQWKEVGRE